MPNSKPNKMSPVSKATDQASYLGLSDKDYDGAARLVKIEELLKALELNPEEASKFMRTSVRSTQKAIKLYASSDINLDSIDMEYFSVGVLQKLEVFCLLKTDARAKIFSVLLETEKDRVENIINELTNSYFVQVNNEHVVKEEDNIRYEGDKLKWQHLRASGQDTPRWSEEKRSNARFQMRISEQLRSRMDEAAKDQGLDRSAWFAKEAQVFLNLFPGQAADDYPDYRTKGVVNLRIPNDLDKQIEDISEALGIKKADWARRLIFHALAHRASDLTPRFTL